MKKNNTKCSQTVALTLLTSIVVFASSAQAATLVTGTVIGVDFGGGADNNFNNIIANGTYSTIIDTSGATVTDIGLTNVGLTAAGILTSNGQADEGMVGQPGQFTTQNLQDWVLSNTGVTLLLTFTNLDNSLTYDLVIGAANGSAQTNVDTTFSVDGQSFTNDGEVGSNAFVSFTGLATDGSGNLVISAINANTSNFGGISALELTAVPEPSTTALLGLGGLALILRRRR